jgi:hypothetical protein
LRHCEAQCNPDEPQKYKIKVFKAKETETINNFAFRQGASTGSAAIAKRRVIYP